MFIEAVLIVLLALICALLVWRLVRQQKILRYLLEKEKQEKSQRPVVWEMEEEKNLELLRKRINLFTLQSQINPHFLYNTLDSIRSKALLDGSKEIADMTQVLSKFFRYCISSNESLVRIGEELAHVKDYFYIQKYRFEERFDMTIDLESAEILEYYIPRMSLQPLVENALVHGLEKVSRKGTVQVKLVQTGERIIITVSDDGVGMPSEQLDLLNERMKTMYISGSRRGGHNSIAVNNINARIKLTFGDAYGLYYRSMPGEGTDGVITIPKIDDFERVHYENKLEGEVR
jgi:two-component system sensor histidine kinase YesM